MKKIAILAAVLAATAGSAYAGGCNYSCAEGFTYSSEKGACVPKTVSS